MKTVISAVKWIKFCFALFQHFQALRWFNMSALALCNKIRPLARSVCSVIWQEGFRSKAADKAARPLAVYSKPPMVYHSCWNSWTHWWSFPILSLSNHSFQAKELYSIRPTAVQTLFSPTPTQHQYNPNPSKTTSTPFKNHLLPQVPTWLPLPSLFPRLALCMHLLLHPLSARLLQPNPI